MRVLLSLHCQNKLLEFAVIMSSWFHASCVCFSGDFESLRLSPGLRRGRSPSPRSPSPLEFEAFRSSSPQGVNQETASISSCPEMVGHTVRGKWKICNHWRADILKPTCWCCFNYIWIKLHFKHLINFIAVFFQGNKDTKKSSTKGKSLCRNTIWI